MQRCALFLGSLFMACSSSSSPKTIPPPAGNEAGPGGNDSGTGDAAVPPTEAGGGGSDAGGSVAFKVIDCDANASDPKCQPPSSSNRGSVGSGPIFSTGGLSDDIRGGFVNGDALVLAVEYGAQDDDLGGIVSVDLGSGKRTLVSGKRSDTEVRGDGTPKLNGVEIPDLGGVWDVKPLPGGHYLAIVSKGISQRKLLVEVDPATGNRTLVWASNFAGTPEQKAVETMVDASKLCDNPAARTSCPARTRWPWTAPATCISGETTTRWEAGAAS